MRLLLITLICFSSSLLADERELLLAGELEFGGFGSPVLKATNITGKDKLLIGGQGALLINKTFYFGGGGGGTARDIGGGFSSYSYGGIIAGMFIQPHKAIHYYADVGLYSGNLSSGGDSNNANDNSAEDFMIIEPGAGIALNIMKYAKLVLGVSFKIVSAVDREDISNDDVGGFSLNGAVLFGSF